MTNSSRDARSNIASLGPPLLTGSGRPSAALGRFHYPQPPVWPVATSAAVHLLLGVALIWQASNAIDRYAAESAAFIPPPQSGLAMRGAASGALAMVSLSYRFNGGPESGAANTARNTVRRPGAGAVRRITPVILSAPDSASAYGDDVYTSFQVDNAAQISAGSAVPRYPPELLARRVQGKVVVRFVVDTTGMADVASVEILDSSAPQFEESVRAALPHMRFSPARLNGRRVRQLVEQPFRFNVTLQTTQTDSSASRLRH